MALTGTADTIAAQDRPRHGRLFPPEELGVLEGTDRDAWQMPDAVMDALGIADGSAVADIGAGGGWFTVQSRPPRRSQRHRLRAGRAVADDRSDSSPGESRRVEQRPDRAGRRSRSAASGESVDAILVVDTYHEFRNRVEILRHLGTALRSAGRIGLVEFKKDGGGPGPPTDERLDEATVIGEAEGQACGWCGRRRSFRFSTC